jgi:hypothetical protein
LTRTLTYLLVCRQHLQLNYPQLVAENLPADPRNLRELNLPEEYKNVDGELFLQFDSGPGDDRILLFSTQRNLDFMDRCNR